MTVCEIVDFILVAVVAAWEAKKNREKVEGSSGEEGEGSAENPSDKPVAPWVTPMMETNGNIEEKISVPHF